MKIWFTSFYSIAGIELNVSNKTQFQMSKHSKRDDTLLGKLRTAILYDMDTSDKRPKDSLRILTNGHIYYREYLRKPKPGDWLEIQPTGLSTLSDRANVQWAGSLPFTPCAPPPTQCQSKASRPWPG